MSGSKKAVNLSVDRQRTAACNDQVAAHGAFADTLRSF